MQNMVALPEQSAIVLPFATFFLLPFMSQSISAARKRSTRFSLAVFSSNIFLSSLVGLVSFAAPVAHAAPVTIFSDDFGAGSNVNDIPGWAESGIESNSSSLEVNPTSGDNSASPDGGRFARMDGGEWICTSIDATGYENLTLSYYWRGDGDAEDNESGIVEYFTGGLCAVPLGLTTIASHELDDGNTGSSSWSTLQSVSLPGALDDTTFSIRYKNDASSANENFRVDAVSIAGDAIVTTGTLTVTKVVVNDDGGTKVVGDFSLFVDGNPVISGSGNILSAGVYAVTETPDPGYAGTFSGDCTATGQVVLAVGESKNCTLTNDDIAVAPSAPDVPTNLSVINNNTYFPTVMWDASSGALTYNIWLVNLNTGLVEASDTGLPTNSFTPSSALTDAVYRIFVSATNASGTSAFSSPLDFAVGTAPTTAPDAPVDFSVSGLDTDAPTVYWAPVDGALTYGIYLINFDTNTLVESVSGLTSPEYTSPSIVDGNYRIWVTATNGWGTSPQSAPFDFEVITAPVSVPDVPTGLYATNTGSYLPTIYWTPSAGASHYNIWLVNLNTGLVEATDTGILPSSFTPSSPLTDAPYRIFVSATNDIGTSAFSTPFDFVVGSGPTSAPATPVNLSVMNESTLFPTVSWDAVPDAVTYSIWLVNLDTGLMEAGDTGLGTNSFTPSSPLNNATYRILVSATNGIGTSPWSDPFDFAVGTAPTTAPDAPTDFSVSGLNSDTPTVYWAPVDGAVTYGVYFIDLDANTLIESINGLTSPEFTPSVPLSPADGTYRIWVTATNGWGTSPQSAPFDFEIITSTVVAPDVPTGLYVTNTGSYFPIIYWTPSAGASHYNIWLVNLDTGLLAESATNVSASSFTPSSALTDAHYRALVNATNGIATSDWSAPLDFTIGTAPTTVPDVPTGFSVIDTDTDSPTVSWNASTGALRYNIWFINADTNTLVESVDDLAATSFTPSSALADGNYRIFVNAENGIGSSAWSTLFDFTVSIPVIVTVVTDTDSDGIEDSSDNCPDDANADQADDDLDDIGNVCDADFGAPVTTIFSGFSAPDTNNGENGSGRGRRTNALIGAANFITGVLNSGNNIAPGAFGGSSSDIPLTDDEIDVICSMHKALPQKINSSTLEWFAGYLAGLMNRDADQVLAALKDTALCQTSTVEVRSSESPVSFDVDAKGFPVSSNATWNKCINGTVKLADIRANEDKDEDGKPRDCSDYHTSAIWYHPDLKIYFTFDKKKKTISLPEGYVLQKQEAVSQL
jgi:hypothetical protein